MRSSRHRRWILVDGDKVVAFKPTRCQWWWGEDHLCCVQLSVKIKIINRIKQHKLESYHTQTKHTALSCYTGSCMAHLNYFPPRVAGVHFCFFIAIPSGGGCWYYANCKMVFCKIDGKMNMQNCGYSAKLRNGDGGDWCSMADGNYSCHGCVPSFFEEMTHCRRQKHHRRWPGNPNGRSKFRKYRVYLPILHLLVFTSTRSRLLLGGWRQSSCHGLAPSFFKEMTRCRCQKHRQR